MWVKRCTLKQCSSCRRAFGQYSRREPYADDRRENGNEKRKEEKNYIRGRALHQQSSICWQVNVLAYISVARQSAHSGRLPSSIRSAARNSLRAERQNTEREAKRLRNFSLRRKKERRLPHERWRKWHIVEANDFYKKRIHITVFNWMREQLQRYIKVTNFCAIKVVWTGTFNLICPAQIM